MKFEYVPLTFITDPEEIKKQVRNTLILIYLFEKYKSPTQLNELIEGTQYGYNASARETGRNKFLRISDIHESKVNWETVPFCDCDDENTYLLENDDILIARTGGTTGKSFKINNPPEHAIYAGYLIRIRAKQEVNPDFIYLFLHSFVYWSQIVNLNERNFRPKANAENLKALILPNCPVDVQREVVQIANCQLVQGYEELYARIDATVKNFERIQEIQRQEEEQLTLLHQLNQAILQEAVQGKLVPQNAGDESASQLLQRIKAEKAKAGKKEKALPPIQANEIPFDIPENWVWCRLGEVCEINPRNKASDETFAGFVPMPLISQDFGVKPKFEVRKWGEIKSGFTHFANDDVVVAKITPCFQNSKAGIVSDMPNGIGSGTTELNVLRGNGLVLPEYIYFFVKRDVFLKNGEALMRGVAGQQRVPTEYFYNTLFPLPPLAEQKRIVAEVEKQLAHTEQLKAQVLANQQATGQVLKALLKEAFGG